MSTMSRLADLQGGPYQAANLASTATLVIPEDHAFIILTGTTTVTSLNNSGNRIIPRRVVVLMGYDTAGTGVVLTNTNASASPTQGQMVLSAGANVMLQRGQTITLIQQANGVWYEIK